MSGRGVVDNVSSIVMAGIVALILWLLATQENHPMRTLSTFPSAGESGLAIAVHNPPAGRAPFDLVPRTVRMKVRGMDEALRDMEPGDFFADVDLADVGADVSTATLPVTVRCPSCARRGIRVVSWEPQTVALQLANAASAARQVVAVPSDESPAGYTRGYEITPSRVTLSGAQPALARVHEVVARLGQMGADPVAAGQMAADRSERGFPAVTVQALDADGEPVLDIAADPPTVSVAVMLKPREVEVAVSPIVRGADAVADGFYLTGISVSPQFVQLEGPTDLVRTIRENGAIPTQPLDLTGRSGDIERRVGLVLPRGVTATNATDGVTVTVKLEPLPGTTSRDAQVVITGLGPGLEVASITPEKVSVLVSGPRPLLEELKPEALRAIVDLSGRQTGAHRVVPAIELPADIQERSVTPNEVEVVIRAVGTPAPTPRGPR